MDAISGQDDPLYKFFNDRPFELKTVILIDTVNSDCRDEGIADPQDEVIDLNKGTVQITANCRGLDGHLNSFEIDIFVWAGLAEEEQCLRLMQPGVIYCASCENYAIFKEEAVTLYHPELTPVSMEDHPRLLELFERHEDNSFTSLNNSTFIHGRQCSKLLGLSYNVPIDMHKNFPESNRFENDNNIRKLSQKLFPDGVVLPFAERQNMLLSTEAAIAAGVTTIYETTFERELERCLVQIKTDILHRAADGWELYMVKSGTGCKDVYLDDIALQWWVLNGCGIELKRAALIHINSDYVRQGEIDVQELFNIIDVSKKVLARQKVVTREIVRQQAIIKGPVPDIDIGLHCDDPYSCRFKEHCWEHIPSPSVFDLRGPGKPDVFELYRQGYINLEDVEVSTLGWRQQLQVNGTLYQQNRFDQPAVQAFLDELWYPLCHLDFETTFMTPVPLFDGTRPYQQVPFQFSLHIEDAPGAEIRHIAFLAEADTDPREEFMWALLGALPENACILTWHQGFESARLRDLAEQLPHWQGRVEAILPTIRDLMVPFRDKAIYHWQFDGSYSLKVVLPALVPELGYDGMEVSNGEEASQTWLRLRSGVSAEEREQLRTALLSYCYLDTWAMVKILEWVRENNQTLL